jgi:hypothetical protein
MKTNRADYGEGMRVYGLLTSVGASDTIKRRFSADCLRRIVDRERAAGRVNPDLVAAVRCCERIASGEAWCEDFEEYEWRMRRSACGWSAYELSFWPQPAEYNALTAARQALSRYASSVFSVFNTAAFHAGSIAHKSGVRHWDADMDREFLAQETALLSMLSAVVQHGGDA